MGAVAFLTAALLATAALVWLSPTNIYGEASDATIEFTVSQYTEQPVHLALSHAFPVSAAGGYFFVTEGPEDIDYCVTISSADGREVFAKNASFDIPSQLELRMGDSKFVMGDSKDLDMPAGKYKMTLSSTHPIDYSITQDNSLWGAKATTIVMDVIAIVVLIFIGQRLHQNRRALRTAQFVAAYSQPSYPPQYLGYHSGGVPAPSYPVYSVPSQPPSQSMMEDEYDTEYICAKCGNIIQNPVVQEVITCEKCGEKEYVGGR